MVVTDVVVNLIDYYNATNEKEEQRMEKMSKTKIISCWILMLVFVAYMQPVINNLNNIDLFAYIWIGLVILYLISLIVYKIDLAAVMAEDRFQKRLKELKEHI